MVIGTGAMPTHWAFYFQGSGLPLSVSGPWSDSMCRAHIALQELQAIAMMLHQMAFHLSGKVVALLPEWYLLPQVAQADFHPWGLPGVDLLASSCSTHYYTMESPLPLEALVLNAFNHPWMFQVS